MSVTKNLLVSRLLKMLRFNCYSIAVLSRALLFAFLEGMVFIRSLF